MGTRIVCSLAAANGSDYFQFLKRVTLCENF
jgi:hypothetical protein